MFWQLVGTLLLGYWWFLLATRQRRFGLEFRKLGARPRARRDRDRRVRAHASVRTSSWFKIAPLALLGFVLQGVSVVHAWAHARHWPPGLVVPLYVLLLVPALNVLVVLPLSVVGVVDNWFDLRAWIRPQT